MKTHPTFPGLPVADAARPDTSGLNAAREDGRPLFFDTSPTDLLQCFTCLRHGITQQYRGGEVYMNDRANSPLKDGATYTVCHGHLPDNAVIYHPRRNTCRTKDGTEEWSEG